MRRSNFSAYNYATPFNARVIQNQHQFANCKHVGDRVSQLHAQGTLILKLGVIS